LAAPPSYIQTKDGVIVFTDPLFTGTSKAVKLEVVSDNIIRVIAAPAKEIVVAQSLVTIYSKSSDLSWNVVSSKEALTLKTKKLTVIVDLKTGAVSFRDHTGKNNAWPLFGRSFEPAIFDGQPLLR
jgi:alpha-D-xyloside xylohydrolase